MFLTSLPAQPGLFAQAINDQKTAWRPLTGLTFSFDFSDT